MTTRTDLKEIWLNFAFEHPLNKFNINISMSNYNLKLKAAQAPYSPVAFCRSLCSFLILKRRSLASWLRFNTNSKITVFIICVLVVSSSPSRSPVHRIKHYWITKLDRITYLSRLTTKPTKWRVRPAKTQISLGIRPV